MIIQNLKKMADPALPIITQSHNGSGLQQSFLSPDILANQLTEYYQGYWSNIAKTWEIMQKRDITIDTVAKKRKIKILKEIQNYEIFQVDNSLRAKKQAEVLSNFYESGISAIDYFDNSNFGGFNKVIEFIIDAIGKQYSFLAKNWEVKNNDIKLQLQFVPMWYFGKDNQELYITDQYGNSKNKVIEDQWLIANYGQAIMESCSIISLFKRLSMRNLIDFLETYGKPSLVARTDNIQGSKEWDVLAEGLQSFIAGFSAIIGKADEIVEIKGENKVSIHMPYISYCDEKQTTLWLHSHLGTKSESGTGTLAGESQANETSDLITSDCYWITEILNNQIDRHVIDIVFGKDQPLLAKIRIKKNSSSANDIQRIETAIRLGLEISEEYIRDKMNIPAPLKGETIFGKKKEEEVIPTETISETKTEEIETEDSSEDEKEDMKEDKLEETKENSKSDTKGDVIQNKENIKQSLFNKFFDFIKKIFNSGDKK